MSIHAINQSVQQHVVSSSNSTLGRFSLSLPSVTRNLNKITVLAIAFFALSNLRGASAGPLEYSACVIACTLFATPVAFPACVTACLPLIFIPTP